MRARILAGGHRASPGFSFTRAISTLVLLIVTNYLTFYASGGVSRLGLSAATGGARSESGAAAHLRDHHGGKGTAVAAPRGAPRAAAANAVAPAPLAADAATAVAIVPRGRPVVSSPLAEFCTAADPPDMSPAVAAEATKRQWDAVASWPHAEMMKLFSYKCFLTSLRHSELRFIPVHICTHDPELDGVMAASFHKWGWWGANADHRFVLAAGYAAGTPLLPVDAERMRTASARARAAGKPYSDTAALVAALGLSPVTAEDKVHSACSRERPVMLDVGGNVGYYTLVAASTGCSVVTVEPLSANVGRLWQSVLANRFSDRVTLYKNVVGKDVRLVTMQLNAGNPGASSVADGNARKPHEGEGAGGASGGTSETVATVILDELFDGSASRPRHPFTGMPIQPADIAMLKVDVEGFDAAALHSLRGLIEVGRPPLIKVEYVPRDVRGTSGCDNVGMMRWLYSLGYEAYAFGLKRPLTLVEWEEHIIPLLLEGKSEELHEKHDLPPVKELYMVHADAPTPAVMEYEGGKAGASPV